MTVIATRELREPAQTQLQDPQRRVGSIEGLRTLWRSRTLRQLFAGMTVATWASRH